MSALSKFFKYLFTGQFGKIFSAMRERIPWYLYHHAAGTIFELDKENYEKTKTIAEIPDGYICRFAERNELSSCAQMTGLNVDEYYRRYDYGNKCFSVFKNNRPVNLNWIHRGSCYVRGMGYSHRAEKNDYYIYGIQTDSSEQGKGLYKNNLIKLADLLFEENARRLIQMVEDGNEAVLHTLPRLGYIKTRRIKHITILGFRKTTTTALVDNKKRQKLFMFPPRDLYII